MVEREKEKKKYKTFLSLSSGVQTAAKKKAFFFVVNS